MESITSVERRIRWCAFKAGIGSRVESRRIAEQCGTIPIRGSRAGYNYREEGGRVIVGRVPGRGREEPLKNKKRRKESKAPLLTKSGHIPYNRNPAKIK
ncbi:hypothetical protein NDU88_004988 [Pleurodeles waltl]|uniref:Uncharacterized protein n=1 Tax=Pleurodeles waltl TaxID=8319 RepID=A0AAV7MAT2_PLEWA|nr:hypothetical protein NDU88_004988 [Pleurodeles waltl]